MKTFDKNWLTVLGRIALILVTFLVCACSPKGKADLPDHWVVLNVEDAVSENGQYTWEFEIDSEGRFDFQILTTGKLDVSKFKARATIAEQEVSGRLKADYIIETEPFPN